MPSLCVLWDSHRLPSEHSSFGWVPYQNTQYTQNIHQLGRFLSQILWPKTNWSVHTHPDPHPTKLLLIFSAFSYASPADLLSQVCFSGQINLSNVVTNRGFPCNRRLFVKHRSLSKYKSLWLALFELSLETHVTHETHCFILCSSVSSRCGHMRPSHGHLLHSMLLLALWPQCCLWKKKTKCFFYRIWFHPKRLDSSML